MFSWYAESEMRGVGVTGVEGAVVADTPSLIFVCRPCVFRVPNLLC